MAVACLLTWNLPVIAQISSGSITGVVQDTQGAIIPGATVTLINQDQGVEARQTITNEAGIYLFSALPAATYTVTVELPGFKTYKKTDVKLFVNDKLGLPAIQLEVGSQAESITVEAQSVQLETVSGERSGVVTGRQMADIALNGRNLTALFKTVPGAPADAGLGMPSINGQRNNQTNFMVDGQTFTDSGVNNPINFGYRLSMDSVAEFKVSTTGQSAEFGRNSGAQIQVATRQGTQEFHGGGYYFKREEGWNANTFTNNRSGVPRQIYRKMQAGYNVGGPVYIPGKFNSDKSKLFFFMSHEWGRSRVPAATPMRITVPTLLERQGNFSQTRDGSGIPVFIKDPLKTGNCTAADQTACFPGNIIPSNRFSPYGPSVLNWLPMPNVSGNPQYNYESQAANEDPSFDEVYRGDYNISNRWKAFVRVIRSHQTQNRPYGRADTGNSLGLTPFYAPTYGWSVTGSITTIISPTMTNEFQYGRARNGIPGNGPPSGSPYYRSVSKIDIPLLYPTADPSGLVPNFGFGGVGGASFQTQLTRFAGSPYANTNPITNFTDNLTRILLTHTLKAGFFYEYAVKEENPFRPYNADIFFDRDPLNPGDTQWAFSNALLGNFRQYRQFSKTVLPQAPYHNFEFYGQDTWKITPKLTLNYGLRVNFVPPLWEKNNLFTNFDPSAYDPSKKVVLYQPVLVGGALRARNPINNDIQPAPLIGAIVPGVGNSSNGIVHAGQNGVPRGLIDSRGPQWGPRLGLAYSLDNKTVIRAGAGAFYERIATSAIGYTTNFNTNPPDVQLSEMYYGNLASIASSSGTLFPLTIVQLERDGHVPTVYNFSTEVQRELPSQVLLSVSYVGTQSRHLIELWPFNALPFGSAWLPENQDPTKPATTNGSSALLNNLYRPYPGYSGGQTTAGQSAIGIYSFTGSANYNALQVSANRRAGRGLQIGTSYTWSKALGTTDGTADGRGHLTDTRHANYGPLTLDRTQGLTFNYIYDIPSLARPGSFLDNSLGRQVFGGWQVSGLSSFSVGAPVTLTYTLTGVANAQRNRQTTGSEDFAPRVVLTCNPNLSRGSRALLAYIDTSCVTQASRGSIGNDSGVNSLRGPGVNNWDVSLFKKFKYGENPSHYIQFRVEAYNVFNHTNWQTFTSTAQINPATGQITNLPSAVGRDGFGALTTVRGVDALGGPRIIQLAGKLYF